MKTGGQYRNSYHTDPRRIASAWGSTSKESVRFGGQYDNCRGSAWIILHNDKHNGMVKDVVKAVKSWKKHNGYRIPSFHIEEIAIGIFNIYSLNNLEEGIRKWFNYAKYYIQKERFNTNNQYNASLDAINDISDELTDAKSKKDNNNEPEAIKIWHSVFGKDFPTISEEDAKKMNSLLTSGNLKYGATTGLSAVSGHAVAASKGFYGEK